MHTGFHTHKRLAHQRAIITRLLIAAACLCSISVRAQQQPSSSTTKPASSSASPQTGASDEITFGDYNVISSVELGVRGLGLDGNKNKYYADRNYRSGFRVFDSSFLVRSKENNGALLDTLLVNSSGFGSDPDGMLRINAEKTKWYRFDVNFRRNAYNNIISCCNFAQARSGGPNVGPSLGLGISQNNYRVKHKLGDFDLKLLPQNRNLRFNLGYSMDRERGPGGSSLTYAREDLAVNKDLRSRSDEVRGGIEAKVGDVDLAFTQGFRFYRDDTSFFSGPNTGNNPANFSVINFYQRLQPMRGRASYSRLSAHTEFANKFDVTARYTYTKSTARFIFSENANGKGYLEGQNVIIDQNTITASSNNIERPTHLFDLGMTYRVNEKLRISDTFRYNTFRVDGDITYSDVRSLRKPNGTKFTPYPIILSLNPSRELEIRRWQNNLEFDYDFSPRLSFYAGHRYIDRRQEIRAHQNVYPIDSGAAFNTASNVTNEEVATNNTNGFFGGFKARPVKAWNIWFDANRGQSDNAFTRLDNYDTLSFRVRNRVELRKGLNANVSFVTRDNNNPGIADESLLGIPKFDVDIKSRIFTSFIDWTSHSRFYINAGYTYQHLTSDVGIIYFAPTVKTGRTMYFLRDHYFFFNTSVQPLPRLTLYAGYNGHSDQGQGNRANTDATGVFIRSYPMSFQSPEARAVLKLNRHLDWSVGYQFYNYKENFKQLFPDLYVPQNYRAHLPYTSLRIYFGGGER